MNLGDSTAIKENVDMDPQQVYEDANGRVYYAEEAKDQVQRDWEKAYEN